MTVSEIAEAILVAHQRRDVSSCLCGWAELGKSHARHQVAMLREAGALAADEVPPADASRDETDALIAMQAWDAPERNQP